MKSGTDDHPKTHDLASKLKINIAWCCGILECLWAFTGDYCPAGDVGKYSDTAIARACHWTRDPHEFVVALTEAGWLDENQVHRLVVHDWHTHCPDYVKKKVKRAGSVFISEVVENTQNVSGQSPVIDQTMAASRARDTQPNPTQPNPTVSIADVSATHKHATAPKTFRTAAANGNGNPSAIPIRQQPITDSGCEDWAHEMYKRHPKKKNRVLAEKAMTELWASMRDPPTESVEISRVHSLWCATTSWTEKSGQYCPQLAEWINDRGYMSEPPEVMDDVDRILKERGLM
jgi:hypothetical protein